MTVSRVILLSDGCANQGLTNPAMIAAQCTEMAKAGVTTSTYGLGEGFNEDLMIAMGRAGRGNNFYGRTAEDLMDPFREELALPDLAYGGEAWALVRLHIAKDGAEALGADNPWVEQVIGGLRDLARRREREMFMKESWYSADRMTTRLASSRERPDLDVAAGPAYLRRKVAQGKREPTPPRASR